MKLDDIRKLARERGLKPAKLNKRELVKMIQRSEGNFDCYASAAHGECDQVVCLWREGCFKDGAAAVAEKPRAVAKKKAVTKKSAPKKKSVAKKKAAPIKKKSVAKKKAAPAKKKSVATKKRK